MAESRKRESKIKVESFFFKYLLSSCAAAVAETGRGNEKTINYESWSVSSRILFEYLKEKVCLMNSSYSEENEEQLAILATYPLDITKTRLQIQGESALSKLKDKTCISKEKIKAKGMFHTAVGIVQEEGLLKLWQGVTPAIYRHLVYSGCRMTFYEVFREKLLKKKSDGTLVMWKSVLCGSASGALGQFLASPTDLVKVQMQMEGRRRLEGHPPRVHSTWHAFTKIVAEGGIRGLWKGWVPNVQRAALVNMGDLTTYDTSKHLILKHTTLKDNAFTHMLASSCSGFIAATLGTPADVVKTRIMNQPTDPKGQGLYYKSSIDCLLKTIQEEGFMALYKGFIPIWTRMAPWSITFWVTYEELRRICGVSSF